MNLKELHSLQRLRLKLADARRLVMSIPIELRPFYRLNYAILLNEIITSIKTTNGKTLKHTNWKHVNRYRRRLLTQDREEAREWLMSDGPEFHWSNITDEDWKPVREQIQRLWHDLNTWLPGGGDWKQRNILSKRVIAELNKEGFA